MLDQIKDFIRKNEVVYNLWFHLTSREYKKNRHDMFSCHVKTKSVILKEMDMLRRYWGCEPDQYILYRLFEKKQNEDELKNWIPPYYFYAQWLPPRQKVKNRDKYSDKITQHKLFSERICPEPQVIAIFKNGYVYDGSGKVPESYLNILDQLSGKEKFFLKPSNGRGGKGIHILEAAAESDSAYARINDKFKLDGEIVPANLLKEKFKNFTGILQKGVHQRADMAELNPDSLNTFRFVTYYDGKNRKIAVVTLRMGRKGSAVDNVDSGGLAVLINAADGSFADTAYSSAEAFKAHPDTGCVFSGRKIKDWKKICAAVLETSEKFKEFEALGWDIALTDEGIKILEFNLRPGLGIQVTANRGLRKEFGIDPEKDYKSNSKQNMHKLGEKH
ncbi:MAG: hypothetical protein K5838_01550 [Elusimicrobiales bacterium]|nr:hypothetical protein [Elusimicrobiales bacterium]